MIYKMKKYAIKLEFPETGKVWMSDFKEGKEDSKLDDISDCIADGKSAVVRKNDNKVIISSNILRKAIITIVEEDRELYKGHREEFEEVSQEIKSEVKRLEKKWYVNIENNNECFGKGGETTEEDAPGEVSHENWTRVPDFTEEAAKNVRFNRIKDNLPM